MIRGNLFCPVCLQWDRITVDLLQRRGRCACGVELDLQKNVWPAATVTGYPDKMMALTGPGESRFKTWTRGDERWFRLRGSWLAKTVILTPERFEQRTRIGTRASEPIANVRGFLPVQIVHWTDNVQYAATWRCCALLEASIIALYPFDDLDAAARASRELSETLWSLKPAGDPFRS